MTFSTAATEPTYSMAAVTATGSKARAGSDILFGGSGDDWLWATAIPRPSPAMPHHPGDYAATPGTSASARTAPMAMTF